MTRYPCIALCLVLIALLAAPAAAQTPRKEKVDPLTMRMSNSIAGARADVLVRMRVAPDARSRELIVEWIADDLSGGAHTITLDGNRAVATHHYVLKAMPPGQYVVAAILRMRDGTEIRRTANLWVVGVGGPGAATVGGGAVAGAVSRSPSR